MATRIAKPALASQAENVRRIIGVIEEEVEFSVRVQIAIVINRVNSMLSKHKSADKR